MDSHDHNGSPTDESLLQRFVTGEEEALGELAVRHEGRLLGLAVGLCRGNEGLAREAVQETWVRVIQHAAGFKGRCSFGTWVYRIAINRCRDVISREQRTARRNEKAESKSTTPEVVTDDQRAWIRHALENLSWAEREIVLLCHMRGMTHEQAAAVLEIPIGTLKTRMTRAMEKLRAYAQSEASS